jgi:predicted PurR-regulated permease PerM
VPNTIPTVKDRSSSTHLLPIITAVVVIGGLYFGKDLVIPFALALLLSFLLSAPVAWLERFHFRRPLAVVVVLTATVLLAGSLIWLALQELNGITQSFPTYRDHIVRKLDILRSPSAPGIVATITKLNELTKEVVQKQEESKSIAKNGHNGAGIPVPVEIVKTNTGLLSSLGFVGSYLIHFLGLLCAVAILTLFMLLNRSHLRNKLFRLLGQGHLVLMTTALDEAAQRVSRYLLAQSVVNTCFGTLLAVGLWIIGLPYAPVWGLMAATLRFLPYVGIYLAGAAPLLLSLALFDGWSKPLSTLILFASIEGLTSFLLEPWLYASRAGVSPMAILLSATFWTLLWGPIGLILATPLTVVMAVLGRYLPPLAFLHVLLGDEPVLTPHVCYYQRMLAMDEEEATELAEDFLKGKSLIELYDELLIPALALAEQDRHGDRLEELRADFMYRNTRDLLDELAERAVPDGEPKASLPSVLCVPVRDDADELIATMLSQVLQMGGYDATWSRLGDVNELLKSSSERPIELVILSALPPFTFLPARAMCRQLRRYHPEAKIIVGLWNSSAPLEKVKERLGPHSVDALATSLHDAKEQLQSLLIPEKDTETVEQETAALIS